MVNGHTSDMPLDQGSEAYLHSIHIYFYFILNHFSSRVSGEKLQLEN